MTLVAAPAGHPHLDDAVGVYVHVPFCAHLCSYCDFYKLRDRDELQQGYVDAARRELDELGAALRRASPAARVDSLYLGGGTPTALSGPLLATLVAAGRSAFATVAGAEITIESNPEDAEPERLAAAREAGANRVSIGIQSLDPGELEMLGRQHQPAAGARAVEVARAAGFSNVNVDVIVGLPGQAVASARRTLDAVGALGVEHVSAYLLELDKPTAMKQRVHAGELPEPDDEVVAECFAAVEEILGRTGLARYEISSLARPGFESRHNVKYWRDEPYLGIGPSASSYFGMRRFTRAADLQAFLRGAGPSPDGYEIEERGAAGAARDAAMLGLRLVAGLDVARLARRHVVDGALEAELRSLEEEGLLERSGTHLRIPPAYLPVANFVFARVVGA